MISANQGLRLRTMRRSTLLLLCCSLLAAVAFGEANSYEPSYVSYTLPEEARGVNRAHPPLSSISYEPPPLSDFDVITTRPLFTHARRPAPTRSMRPEDGYKMLGVLLLKQRNVALVERRSDGTLLHVSEGDILDVWRVVLIDATSVILRDASETYTMKLSEAWEEVLSSANANVEKEVAEENSPGINVSQRPLQSVPHERDAEGPANHAPPVPGDSLPPPPTPPRRMPPVAAELTSW